MVKPKAPRWVNAKGVGPSPGIPKPDLKRCEARPNMLGWSFMTLGPKPEPIRCERATRFVVIENKAREDGKIGIMGVCGDCLVLLRKHTSPTFAKVYPVEVK
jgi:hypothetical protein